MADEIIQSIPVAVRHRLVWMPEGGDGPEVPATPESLHRVGYVPKDEVYRVWRRVMAAAEVNPESDAASLIRYIVHDYPTELYDHLPDDRDLTRFRLLVEHANAHAEVWNDPPDNGHAETPEDPDQYGSEAQR